MRDHFECILTDGSVLGKGTNCNYIKFHDIGIVEFQELCNNGSSYLSLFFIPVHNIAYIMRVED